MISKYQRASQSEARLASQAVICLAETGPTNPQASYYRARYYDTVAGRFVSEDLIGFAAGRWDLPGSLGVGLGAFFRAPATMRRLSKRAVVKGFSRRLHL